MRPDSATPATGLIQEQHRTIENWLDHLAGVLAGWTNDPLPLLRPLLRDIWPIIRAHYQNEEAVLFRALRRDLPDVVGKMEQQHAYAAELITSLEALLQIPQPTVRELHDIRNIANHFQAIAQHNIIEEQRELLRLADQLLSRTEQEGLYLQLVERRAAASGDRST
jgi:hemerythrin-like domain-containing protein